MSAITKTQALVLQNFPTKEADLSLGSDNSTFKLVEQEVPELQEREFLVKTVFLSNDPAQRGWMQERSDEDRSYLPFMRRGEAMNALAVGQVVASESSVYQVGQLVMGMLRWTAYGVHEEKPSNGGPPLTKLDAMPGFSPSVFLGAFGWPGLTAYFGLHDILKFQKGESIVVSGAAGAVGNMVVQYAKNVIGASKVVAIAGSKEKVEWLKTIGADVAINYKDSDFKQQLNAATEGFVDAYFDNVGGDMLDHMVTRVKQFGRIAACGAISTYNSLDQTRFPNYSQIITSRLNLQGFIVLDYMPRFPEGIAALVSAVKEGKLVIKDAETLVHATFKEIPKTWGMLFEGGNTGKLITQVADLA